MKRLPLLCTLSAVIFSFSIAFQAHAEAYRLRDKGGWSLDAWFSDSSRQFSFCTTGTHFDYGDIRFQMSKRINGFSILTKLIGFSIPEGISRPASVFVDENDPFTLTADGILPFSYIIFSDDNLKLYDQIRRGRWLFIKIDEELYSFNLRGAEDALTSLLSCAKSGGRDGGASSQSEPAPRPRNVGPAAIPPAPNPRGPRLGSGFFVRTEGSGITNAHVVNGCTTATIEGYGRARITARDKTNDLALVQLVDPKRTEAVQLARRPLKLGEFVYALGFPLPGIIDNGLNFTGGQVSSLSGLGGDTRHFQLSAPIQPGNSGGPVVNTSGQLVGVTRARLDDVATLEASGALPQNVNYAIRSDIAASFLRANGIDPSESESAAKLDPTDIATAGRGYTFQIRCTVE